MPEIQPVQCSNCIFFKHPADAQTEQGLCFRFPPTVFPQPVQSAISGKVTFNTLLMRPTVKFGEFCGEFQPIDRSMGVKNLN